MSEGGFEISVFCYVGGKKTTFQYKYVKKKDICMMRT